MGEISERKILWITAGAAVFKKGGICSGFTLIELLVYMAIMSFIIIVAGRVFSDSTAMRVRSQSMIASSEEAGRVSALLKEDISQMGVKSWATPNTNSYSVANAVYQNSNDASSFELISESPDKYDRLKFRKILYNNEGHCIAVVEIEWYVEGENKALKRKCSPKDDDKCPNSLANECPDEGIEMARNVEEFRFFPSIPGAGSSSSSNISDIFPSSLGAYQLIVRTGGSGGFGNASKTGNKVTISNFILISSNSSDRTEAYIANEAGGSSLNDCAPFTFEKGEEYSIYFEMPCPEYDALSGYHPMQNFQPGKDHLSVGLRKRSDGKQIDGIPDFLFYPPQNPEACTSIEKKQRHFNFSVPSTVADACVAMTIALYSDAYRGKLEFENFKISRNSDKMYHFDSDNVKSDKYYSQDKIPLNKKADVKAFQLFLGVKKREEVNRVITVIPVPNNGLVLEGGG